MNKKNIIRNRGGFGIGTIGRDALYTMVSMYQMFYLTDILKVSTGALAILTIIIVLIRIFDGINDPFMGIIIDNTKTKFGKFKPWIFGGAILWGIFSILMFSDFQLNDTQFIIGFTIVYLLWEISFTANDIAFWSMLPSLSQDQKERNRLGAFARICANIGMFAMVVGILPLTQFISDNFNVSMQKSYFLLALAAVLLMWFFQIIMIVLVKEDKEIVSKHEEPVRFSDLFKIIAKNDQLLWIALSMTLFMIGYTTTTSFGLYYFKYIYGDESMYSTFAIVLAISQLSALAISPFISKVFNRKKLYFIATVMVVIGYMVFFLAPTTTMTYINLAGVLMFVGQALIQLLMLMFITDTVEYGEYRNGSRHESVTLSIQSFIYKIGSAVANGIVGYTVILTGIKGATEGAIIVGNSALLFKVAMILIPLILIALGYVVYRRKYIINEDYFTMMVKEIGERKQKNETTL